MEWNNYKNIEAGCDKYGNDRLKLAVFLRDNVFKHLKHPIFIENGTLLGAWRDHKFIAHDDDFDFGILIDNLEEIDNIYRIIGDNLPNSYKYRLVKGYADKIEIYDPTLGNYKLSGPAYNNADYHYITVDLQFYLKDKHNSYRCLYYINPNKIVVNKSVIVPTDTILLEGELFNCPKDIEQFLINNYNYLGKDAEYSAQTGLYYKKKKI